MVRRVAVDMIDVVRKLVSNGVPLTPSALLALVGTPLTDEATYGTRQKLWIICK